MFTIARSLLSIMWFMLWLLILESSKKFTNYWSLLLPGSTVVSFFPLKHRGIHNPGIVHPICLPTWPGSGSWNFWSECFLSHIYCWHMQHHLQNIVWNADRSSMCKCPNCHSSCSWWVISQISYLRLLFHWYFQKI